MTRQPFGEGAVSEGTAVGREILRGVKRIAGMARIVLTGLFRETPVQAVQARNAVNPRIGSRLQQHLHREVGASRRGGEKPRGRNGTCSLARTGQRSGALRSERLGCGRLKRRPDGGDLEKETRRSHRMTGAARGERACTWTSKTNWERLRERFRGSHGDGFDAGGEAELAKNTGGQVRVATSGQTDLSFRTRRPTGSRGTT